MASFLKKIKVNHVIAILLTIVIVAGVIVVSLHEKAPVVEASPEEISEYINSVKLKSNFRIISTSDCCGQTANTLEAITAGISAGARLVELNVAFREDGTPVLAQGFDYINEYSVTLTQALELIAETDYVNVLVNFTELGNLSTVWDLLVEYNFLSGRVYFSGIDSDSAQYFSEYFMGYTLFCNIDLTTDQSFMDAVSEVKEFGATGVRINIDDMTDELYEEIKNSYDVRFIIDGAETTNEFYKALSLSPDAISTSDPATLQDIIVTENLYDR